MKISQPTSSYKIGLSDDIIEDHDGRIVSYWKPGSSVLLQLSSTLRIEGDQVSAVDRLHDLYKRSPADWTPVDLLLRNFPGDCAAAQMRDEKGVTRIHAYLTTDSLAVYATVSGPQRELEQDEWALEAIRGLDLRAPVVN
jgi:hypothetical protein